MCRRSQPLGPSGERRTGLHRLRSLLDLKGAEALVARWGAAQFFLLLSSLYVIRPLRDEMGIASGVENMQWLFSATFAGMLILVPLYGRAVARLGRRVLVPGVYATLAAVMVLAWVASNLAGAGARPWVAAGIFVWVSVFNLLAVSLFWSFMADLLDRDQAKRVFGVCSAGGSLGALAGPAITAGLAERIDPPLLLWIAAALLVGALACAVRMERAWRARQGDRPAPDPVGGASWAGLLQVLHTPALREIAAFVLLLTWVSTIFYFEQAHIVEATIADPGARTALFARVDLAVNLLAVGVQAFLTDKLLRWLGMSAILTALPLVSLSSLVLLGLFPTLGVLVGLQVVRRATQYALSKPAREVLYTLVTREERFKGKSVIDLLVYRGGDAAAGWGFSGLSALGLGLSAIAWVTIPLAALWAALAHHLGRRDPRDHEPGAPRRP